VLTSASAADTNLALDLLISPSPEAAAAAGNSILGIGSARGVLKVPDRTLIDP
jgi:hypothetical protein